MFIIILGWANINKLKAFSLLPLGIILSMVINAIRIYFILVAGALVSPKFAMGAFHANIGWILFSAYFLGFVFFTYDWMLIKKKR
jgi:exosortase/archaeosortase family protein